MKKNMGNFDRIMRVVIAVIIGFLYFGGILTGITGILLIVLAGIFILTSVISFCPIYTLLGVNTCKITKG